MKKLVFAGALATCLLNLSFADTNVKQKLLSDNIPYPFYSVHKTSEGKSNQLMILNSGIASLEKRLDMIKQAKRNIEIEYFIFNIDQSSKLILQELVKAANRGVKVRMLLDKSAAIFVLDEWYAKALSMEGKNGGSIELRYYNAASLWRLSSINFRNHRKLISVDDEVAITGGRNVEDDYYDLSEEYNFLDRDVYIDGDMVKVLRESFDEYFDADISERPVFPKKPEATKKITRHKRKVTVSNEVAVKAYEKKLAAHREILHPSQHDLNIRKKVKALGLSVLSKQKMHSCPELTYVTDRPGGNMLTRLVEEYSDNYRYVRKTLYDKISQADKRVILDSPYMINNIYSGQLMDQILDNGVEIVLYTNSLASTDAVYVAANLYKDVDDWAELGIKAYVHDGKYLDEGVETITAGVKDAIWGTHSKTQVYEGKDYTEVMIGTYNIDNRSNHYNNEMAVFCKGSDAITDAVRNNIVERINNSYEIHEDGTATNRAGEKVNVLGSNSDKEMSMRLMAAPSWMLRWLL